MGGTPSILGLANPPALPQPSSLPAADCIRVRAAPLPAGARRAGCDPTPEGLAVGLHESRAGVSRLYGWAAR